MASSKQNKELAEKIGTWIGVSLVVLVSVAVLGVLAGLSYQLIKNIWGL